MGDKEAPTPDLPGDGLQRNINVETGTKEPMSHPEGKQMIQDSQYPAQALPAQPTPPNPSGLKGSTKL